MTVNYKNISSSKNKPLINNVGDIWHCAVDEVSYIYDGETFLPVMSNNDPYAQLEEFEQEKEEDETLRQDYPSLQIIYEEYQMVKKLVKDYDKE